MERQPLTPGPVQSLGGNIANTELTGLPSPPHPGVLGGRDLAASHDSLGDANNLND